MTALQPAARRLVLVSTAIAAVVGVVTAVALFALVREARLRDSLDRAAAQARAELRLAATVGPHPQRFVEAYEQHGIHALLVLPDGSTFASSPAARVDLPGELRALVGEGQLASQRVSVEGTPTLIVGGPSPGRDAELYFLFDESTIGHDLAQLALALALVVVAVTLTGFALGRVASGRVRASAEREAWERRFTADVSHELRTPVAALVSEAEVLGAHLDAIPPEARRAAELVVRDVARLRRLVDDLLDVVRGAIASRGWSDRVPVEGDGGLVISDPSAIDRIVANLVENGLEHGGGSVSVRIGRDGDAATVEVRDRGGGIDPEDLPNVFDRFYRADPSRTRPGSGLGLAIAREHARRLGGDIDVQSESGTGARFTLRLPVAEPLPGGDRRVTRAPDDEDDPIRRGKQ